MTNIDKQNIKELKQELKLLKQNHKIIEDLYRKQQQKMEEIEHQFNEHKNDPMGHEM